MKRSKPGILKAYASYWRNGLNFRDRTSRAGFWWVVLLNTAIGAALFVSMFLSISGAGAGSSNPIGMGAFVVMFASWPIVNVIPGIAMTIRRLHDVGKSWLYYLLSLIPIVGTLILLLFITSETKGPPENRFGRRPQV